MKFKCHCDPATVDFQEYQQSPALWVPDFIDLTMNNPDQTKRKSVCVDVCMIPEIWFLWRQGIKTTGCCCGHNKGLAYIGVQQEFIQQMKDLGYEAHPNPHDEKREDSFWPKFLPLDER